MYSDIKPDDFATLLTTDIEATYSAEDNKLRLYPSRRLDEETFKRVKEAGFKWAPRQELFVAPKWTPAREDLCVELAGEIEPEATTMAERAEVKADRLEAIANKKAQQANAFHQTADDLSSAFDFGQPILVGHHSERKARKTQERMQTNMNKAEKAFKAIDYYAYKAKGVELHANRKNNARVRAGRIKTLLAELRDLQRTINDAALALKIWDEMTTYEAIHRFAGYRFHTLQAASYENAHALNNSEITHSELKRRSIECLTKIVESTYRRRWINHTLNRLGYERDMLGPVARFVGDLSPTMLQIFTREHGAHKPKATDFKNGFFKVESVVDLPMHLGNTPVVELSADEWRDLMQSAGYEVPAKKAALPPILNFEARTLHAKGVWVKNKVETFKQVPMTKADYAKIRSEQRGTRLSLCGTFWFKICPDPFHEGPGYSKPWVAAFLTDSKVHDLPETFKIKDEGEGA